VISEEALIVLLYHADWTKLSLSAGLNRVHKHWEYPSPVAHLPWSWSGTGSGSLLIAPGGRYRIETTTAGGGRTAEGSDGEWAWSLTEPGTGEDGPDEAAGKQADGGTRSRVFGRPEPPAWTLTCPAWLLNEFGLTPGETATVAGRPAHLAVATPSPGHPRLRHGPVARPDRVEVAVDAELGILLRCEQTADGELVRLDELLDVRLDPPEAGDPAQFLPPPGVTVSEDGPVLSGPGWRIVKTAAGLAGTGLGFAIRHAPHRPPPPPADGAAMPWDYLASAPGQPGQGEPVTDELLGVLARAGHDLPGLAAELHQWNDPRLVTEKLRSAWSASGLAALRVPGAGPVADAVSGHLAVTHRVARIRVAPPGRYRIDYLSGWPRRTPTAVACNGERRWRLYRDHMYAGPARPMPHEIADLLDPSWLLGWQLSGGSEVTVRGRRGFRIDVTGTPPVSGRPAPILFPPAEAVADADLGILLRLTSYTSSGPAMVFELRGVSLVDGPDGDVFRINAPPGVRVIEDSGGLLDEADAPEPVRAAVRAVTDIRRLAGTGVSAVSSFLDAFRGPRQDPPQP
jgi:outer membrane lipoprotein-sorting protein